MRDYKECSIRTLNSELKTNKIGLRNNLICNDYSQFVKTHQIMHISKIISGKLLTQTNKFIGWRVDSVSKYLTYKYQYPTFSNWILYTFIVTYLNFFFSPKVFITELKPFLLINNHPFGITATKSQSCHLHLLEPMWSIASSHTLSYTFSHKQNCVLVMNDLIRTSNNLILIKL